jgi:hypothetical protein
MKKMRLLILMALGIYSIDAKSDCLDVYGDLNNAYANVRDAYEANNISHLKYYSQRSLELFKTVQIDLKDCDCDKAYELAIDATEILKKIKPADTYEDGRYLVKRARELGSETITALDMCTISETNEDEADLEREDEILIAQDVEIARKEAELKQLHEQRRLNEIKLKKEILVKKNEAAIAIKIKSFNDVLAACDCTATIEKESYNMDALLTKDIDVIKHKYLTINQSMTLTYLAELKKCGSK